MGRFFIVSASYTCLAKFPQEIFLYTETITVHSESNGVLLGMAIKPWRIYAKITFDPSLSTLSSIGTIGAKCA
jgi:hypothetical protein